MVLNKTLNCIYGIWLDSRKVFTWTKLFERFFCRAVSNFSLDVNVDKYNKKFHNNFFVK